MGLYRTKLSPRYETALAQALMKRTALNKSTGCKRRIFDPEYLDSLQKKNVALRNEGIQEFTDTGIIGTSGDEYRASPIYEHCVA